MGRREEFDPDRALDDAIELSWERGWDAASMAASSTAWVARAGPEATFWR